MANNVKRLIKEDGVVLEKIFKAATNAFKGQDGREVEAQPDRYVLKVVSGVNFSKETGFENSTVLEYKVDKTIYDKVIAYTEIIATYELSNYGAKAVSVALKNK